MPATFRASIAWALASIAAALGLVPAAQAANADITVTVEPVPVQVSAGRTGDALVTYAAYRVSITNTTNNKINQVVFSATASVAASPAGPFSAPVFVETLPAGVCAPTTSPASITCPIGQLTGGTGFVVIYRAPALPAETTYDGTASVAFNYAGSFSNAASPTTPTAQNGVFGGLASTALITTLTEPIRQGMKSYIPSIGGTFLTGQAAHALELDPSTTRIKVPSGLGLTTVEVSESVADGGITNDVLTTNTTSVVVPKTTFFGQPVTVELRRDSSTIRVFKQIGRAYLEYSSTAGEPWQVSARQLFNCAAGEPNTQVPVCIAKRVAIDSKTTDADAGVITDQDLGDWLFILKVLQNGNLRW